MCRTQWDSGTGLPTAMSKEQSKGLSYSVVDFQRGPFRGLVWLAVPTSQQSVRRQQHQLWEQDWAFLWKEKKEKEKGGADGSLGGFEHQEGSQPVQGHDIRFDYQDINETKSKRI